MITVLTPTYNRENTLTRAYKSLLEQTNKNFEWIIVDDGSNDQTKKLIKSFIEEKKITIHYYYKNNGGKHTALNLGISKSKGELLIILDSDDFLTKDAIETIYFYQKKYQNNTNICGFSFLRLFPDGKKIGESFPQKEIISNHIDFRYNQNLLGDMAEVFKTSILKQYPFPIFNNERFLSEAIVWNKISLKYDTVYINKGIYIGEYLEGGLSNNFLKLVYNNPIGASENANLFLIPKFKLSIRIKNAILYTGYSLLAKKKIKLILKESNNLLLTILFFPLGFIFNLYLKLKMR